MLQKLHQCPALLHWQQIHCMRRNPRYISCQNPHSLYTSLVGKNQMLLAEYKLLFWKERGIVRQVWRTLMLRPEVIRLISGMERVIKAISFRFPGHKGSRDGSKRFFVWTRVLHRLSGMCGCMQCTERTQARCISTTGSEFSNSMQWSLPSILMQPLHQACLCGDLSDRSFAEAWRWNGNPWCRCLHRLLFMCVNLSI